MSGADPEALGDRILLFCLGAQKAGTTWLHDLLAAHPDAHVPRVKEVHYWDARTVRSEDAYVARALDRLLGTAERLACGPGRPLGKALARLGTALDWLEMHGAAPGDHAAYLRWITRGSAGRRVIADITPAYALLSRDTLAEMCALAPGTRFLFILRDPLDRVWSSIRMAANKDEPDAAEFARRCAARARSFAAEGNRRRGLISAYEDTVTALDAAVPADRRLYLFHEGLFEPETVAALLGFLGLAPVASDPARRSNPGRPLELPEALVPGLLARLMPTYRFCAARFGAALPARWRARIEAFGGTEAVA